MSPYEKKLPELLDGSAAYYYNKGVNFYNQNNLDSALFHLNLSHGIKPKDYRPLFYLGQVYYKMNNFSKAKEMWSQGLSFNPGDPVLQNALKSVANY
jgi:tetratricopeptide (TPR) repeat protein